MTAGISSRGGRLFGVLAILGSFAAVAGCGSTTIDQKKAEDAVKQKASAGSIKVASASCPSGVTAKKGGTFDCSITYTDNSKATVTVHMTDDSGTVNFDSSDVHPQPGGGGGTGTDTTGTGTTTTG